MPSFADLLQQGAVHAWLFMPSAVLLGVLHGLEPGHSKTLMAAFIVAIRGTVGQAVLLGLAATVSHTLVVWGIALGGLTLWRGLDADAAEPYFQVASAVVIIGVGLWMLRQIRRDNRRRAPDHHHRDHHHHDHHHHPRGHDHHHHPHGHDHPHTHEHGHDHPPVDLGGDDADAHGRAHAEDIRRRFAGRTVTNGQILMFGLTGGLIPCPAAITVLLLCLQVRELALGAVLVLCFSIGLAITLVTVGAVAALGVRHIGGRVAWFGALARRAPYVSGLLIIAVGIYIGLHGLGGLAAA
ncbi:nickel/cobalt efflux transporter [Chthonobacter albigriseus]|uniref:nickel/cobalt efflux transporter n=1 Tax=Chthonobacter albigriseus TaxID=1683161 RepID=UPI0015EF4F4E|nr:nickel/cobalt efflux transporter [Chthonobacter albigriseus]